MHRLITLVSIVGLLVSTASIAVAQDAGAAIAKVEQAKKAAEAAQAKVVAEKTEPAKMVNVQVEITLTDQLGSATPTKKIVSLITSDGQYGRIRSGADAAGGPVLLNIDATPRLVPGNDQIRLSLTIEYRPPKAMGDIKADSTNATSLNQSLTVIMTNGKPMIVSQAADPVTDRKIVVEAKATILK
jgi:hypothetical protein